MSWKCSAFKTKVIDSFLVLIDDFLKYIFRFGDGYTILVRINIDMNRQILIEYIQKSLPDIIIKEEHNKMIHFRVATNIRLYKIFSILEKARDDLKDFIEDYTVSQVTLDDVFVNFAKIQQDKELE